MNSLVFIALCLLCFSTSYFGTKYFQLYAFNKGIIDRPNHRSSHVQPKSSGGGLIIVILANFVWLIALIYQLLSIKFGLTLMITGSIIALVGYIDDHGGISRKIRFTAQLVTISASVIVLYPDTNLNSLYNQANHYPWFSIPIVIFSLLWLTNLYNFMDGIDGIAASEALTVLIATAITLYFEGEEKYATILIMYGVIIAGFLSWNWPPAKLFMGDIGSTYLGVIFGLLALFLSEKISLWYWVIILGCFIADASWTLLTRILTGQKWRDGHRLHAYQKLSQKLNSHKSVTILYSTTTLIWLLPMSCQINSNHYMHNIAITTAAYTPILIFCYLQKAGISSDVIDKEIQPK